MTEVNLYFPEEKSVNIQTKITTRLKVEFMEQFKELKEDPQQQQQIEIYKASGINSNGEASAMNIGDMLELARMQRKPLDPELILHNDKVYCKLLKTIIDKKSLTELEVKALDTDEFWDEQDMTEVTKAVTFFRSKIAI